jgi:hypothetical protein
MFKQSNLTFLFLLWLAFLAQTTNAQNHDLQLTATTSNANPSQFSTFFVTFTISNVGTSPVSGVAVSVPFAPNGLIAQGGNEFVLSQGTYTGNGSGWQVGTLAVNASATIRLNYFVSSVTPSVVYAQVVFNTPDEADSTPANGIDGQPFEDDEAAVGINGGVVLTPICQPRIESLVSFCDNNGTPNLATDDQYFVRAQVFKTLPCGINWSGSGQSGNYTNQFTSQVQPTNFGAYPISAGNRTITIADIATNASASINAIAPSTCNSVQGVDPCPTNLVTNGSFENGLTGWTLQTGTIAAVQTFNNAAHGTKGLYLSSEVGGFTGILQEIPIQSGTQYEFSIYIKNLWGGQLRDFKLIFYNAANQFVPSAISVPFTTSSTTYGLSTLTFTAPVGATKVQLDLHVHGDGDFLPGGLLIDNICLRPAGSAACAIIAAASTPICNNNGTPNNATDDTYGFSVNISKTGSCGTNWSGGGQNGVYGISAAFGPFAISGGNRSITFNDVNNPTVTSTITVIAPATCSGSVGGGCIGNLLTNNGFESDFASWENPNSATIITDAQSGTKAMSLCIAGSGRVYQFKTATAGTNYTFKAFAKKTGTAPTNIFIKFMNSGFSPIQTDFQQVTSVTYTEVTLSKLAPTGAAYMEIGFIKDNGTGCLFADEACLTTGGGTNPCSPDVTPPTISGCPANISLQTTTGSANVTWTAPTATDACSTATLTSNAVIGASFPIGTTTVTYTARDVANNTAICTFTVTVSNQVVTGCTGNLLNNNGFESGFGSWENPNGATITGDVQSGSTAMTLCPAGAGRVYQFKTATAGTTYTFKAFAKKTGTAPTNIFIKFMNSGFSPIQTDFQQVTSIAYTEVTLSKLAPTGAAYMEVGFIKDTGTGCIFGDEACLTTGGGTNPCSPDILAPTIAGCPSNINLTTTAASSTATWTAPTASDNCGTATITGNYFSGQSFPLGSTTVTYTARDAANNTAVCNFSVTVSQNGGGNQADLDIINLNVPTTTIAAGAVISYSFTARNIGTLATGNFSIKAYFSTDNVLSANDIQDGTINTGNFTPGTANIVNGASTVPASLAAGNYFLIIKIDADNQVVESNENNNNAASISSFTVTNGGGGSGADLQVTVTADKTQVAQWSTVTYTFVAKNNGTSPITSANIKVGGCNATGFQLFSNTFGLVYAGAPGQATVGSYNSFTQDWVLTNLAAGQSSTLTLALFSTITAERKVVAFASSQSPTDPDSQPSATLANCTPTQDDEALWTINMGQTLLSTGIRQQIAPLDATQIADFQLFPNPAGEILNIDLTQWMGKTGKLIFINQLGKVVFEKTFENISSPIESMDLSGFNNGQYFVKMETAGQRTQVKRLVVSRMY